MSRLSKFLFIFTLIVFMLACNFVTQPIKDVQNAASTVQSVASAMPLETLQSFATNMPVETIQAISSSMPDFGNMVNPTGEPVANWNDIPIMTEATIGEEINDTTYSYKASVTPQEVADYYKTELENLGWSATFNLPVSTDGGLLLYSSGSKILTITISVTDNETLVILALAQ